MIGNKMLFLFALISNAFAGEIRIVCDGVIFNDAYYDKEILFENHGRPYNLVLHKYSGVLFFSHTVQNGTLVDFGIVSCHVERRKCMDIDGMSGGYAIAYDLGNDDIYFGGHDGIYKYNFMTRAAEFFAEQGKSIWGLFVKNHFYYIEYPTQKLYVYQNDMFVKVAEAQNIEVDHFFISKRNDIYFSNKTALYKIERTDKDVLHLNDEIMVRQITEDAYGDVYFVASDGIYLEDKPFLRIKRVAKIDEAFGLTFDGNDHAIYSDISTIYRLVPSNHSGPCYEGMRIKPTEPYERFVPKDIFGD